MKLQQWLAALVGTASASFFVPSTTSSRHEQRRNHIVRYENPNWNNDDMNSKQRRSFLQSLVVVVVVAVPSLFLTTTTTTPASAYDKTYPLELELDIDATTADTRRQQAVQRIQQQQQQERNAALRIKPVSATLWATALWFVSGSRSNPVLTSLANVFYDANDKEWLRDRNDGLFANVPVVLYVAMLTMFFAAGAVTDTVAQVCAGPAVSLPWAGVCVVTGAALELGRVASGDKGATRDEMETRERLEREFVEFAHARLVTGGNCHRQDILKAFRRYYAKYRSCEGLTDLEIERLIKSWSQSQTTTNIKMSSSGFYSGVRINTEADVFVERRR